MFRSALRAHCGGCCSGAVGYCHHLPHCAGHYLETGTHFHSHFFLVTQNAFTHSLTQSITNDSLYSAIHPSACLQCNLLHFNSLTQFIICFFFFIHSLKHLFTFSLCLIPRHPNKDFVTVISPLLLQDKYGFRFCTLC